MLFTDPQFIFLFLPAVLLLATILPRLLRNPILLVASLLFYGSGEGVYIWIMVMSILFNFAAAFAIDRAANRSAARLLIIASIAGNLGVLVWFKYLRFLLTNLNLLLHTMSIPAVQVSSIHLPIGISFFTFQAMSYVIDVYRRDVRCMRNPLDVALYISLFPQLIAGPIVRAKTVINEIRDRRVTLDDFSCGARRFIIGLGKKLIIADTVASAADAAFGAAPHELTFGLAWLGLIAFTIQIYYDFSGYSDMAIGMGRMLGFHFLENFRHPYWSSSVTEFWRRWHISLSTWFRDYLYIPLGGNRAPRARVYANLLIVFLLCGLWHGAAWTFVAWGAWHGGFLILERTPIGRLFRSSRGNAWLRRGYALAVVLTGWVLFRSPSLASAGTYFAALAGFAAQYTAVDVHFGADVWGAVLLGTLFAAPVAKVAKAVWWRRIRRMIRQNNPYANSLYLAGRLAGLVLLAVNFLGSLMQVAAGTHNPFIYFRF